MELAGEDLPLNFNRNIGYCLEYFFMFLFHCFELYFNIIGVEFSDEQMHYKCYYFEVISSFFFHVFNYKVLIQIFNEMVNIFQI